MITARLYMPVVLTLAFAVANLIAADISINITQPAAGAPVSESLVVQARVSSVFELSSVTAAVADRRTNLVFFPSANLWTNTLSLVGMSRGPASLTVTAQDLLGSTTQTERVFLVDDPPTLTVLAPLNGTVARPQLYLEATATDDDPAGVVINVYRYHDSPFPWPLLLRGTNVIKGTVSIPPGGSPLPSSWLVFEAVDSSGQRRYIPRQVLLEPNSNLVEVAAAPGPLLDVTRDRFLYSLASDIVSSAPFALRREFGKPEVRILHRGTDRIDMLSGDFPTNVAFGFLASTGALVGYVPDVFAGGAYDLYSWPETNVVSYYGLFGPAPRVIGDTLAWLSGGFGLRDIVRTNQQAFVPVPGTGFQITFDLGPNLDLVYAAGLENVYRNRPASPAEPYLNRTTVLVTTNGGHHPITDGSTIIYSRNTNNNSWVEIVMLTPLEKERLALWPTLWGAHVQYQMNTGWVAFTKPGSAGQAQIWTRSPSGTYEQRSFFSLSSSLESLGPQGEVTFINQNVTPAGRYLALPGAFPIWISSPYAGRVKWDGGKLLLLLGRSVFEVHTDHLACTKLTSGDIKLTFSGLVGSKYAMQTSSNLLEWSELLMFTNSTGTATWTNQPVATQQFYRTVVAPN